MRKKKKSIEFKKMKRFSLFLFLGIFILTSFIVGTLLCKPVFANYCRESITSTQKSIPTESQQLAKGYFTYTPLLVDQLRSQNKKVVLYFYAPWCVTCTSLDKEFTQGTALIPDDVIVLRLEYDANPELKTKYGITLPHTFVYIDRLGEIIQQWIGDDVTTLFTYTR